MSEPPPAGAAAPETLRRRRRGELLEFLKFRVLAAQDAFFQDLAETGAKQAGAGQAAGLRHWLQGLGVHRFDCLADHDLLEVLATARRLYVD